MIKTLLCHKSSTLMEALQVINQNAKGATFIVDDQQKLCGVLTDGDIRRLLLQGHQLQEPIHQILPKDLVYADQDESPEVMFSKLNRKIRILPIVNDEFQVIDYMEFRGDFHAPIVTPDLKGNEFQYLMDAFLSTWISSSGHYVERFEQEFSRYCQCPYGVATSSGTTALHLALTACGVGAGDEVIIPDLTFAATINAVLYTQATPVVVDVEQESWCIDPAEIEKAITPRTKAIIPVHLYGQPCAMDRIMAIAQQHDLIVIEDCAQAHGALFAGRKIGSFGQVGCFSFFGNKIITTGEGGMCVTSSPELDQKMRTLRDHGMSRTRKYWHEVVGFNYRLTNLQAAVGVAQLERIDTILVNRLNAESAYREALAGFDFLQFQRDDLPQRKKITWIVSALIDDGNRDGYLASLQECGIDARPLFYALSRMPLYKPYIFSSKVSEQISRQGISFPTGSAPRSELLEKIKEFFLNISEGLRVKS